MTAILKEMFSFLLFLKRLLTFLIIDWFNLYRGLITKAIASNSIVICGIEAIIITIELLKLRCNANADTIPVIILVEIIFKKYKKGIGISESINI